MARPIKKYQEGGEVSARKKKRRARKDGTAPEKMTAKKAGPIKTKTKKADIKVSPKMAADKFRMETTQALKKRMEGSRKKFLRGSYDDVEPGYSKKVRKEIDDAVAKVDRDIRSGKYQDDSDKMLRDMGISSKGLRKLPRYPKK